MFMNNYYIIIIIIINERHCSTVICHCHYHCIDGGGCHVHHGHDSCCGNGVHVSDGDCSNGGCAVLVLPAPHGDDECASPGVEHG
jgi:hypothetical protein